MQNSLWEARGAPFCPISLQVSSLGGLGAWQCDQNRERWKSHTEDYHVFARLPHSASGPVFLGVMRLRLTLEAHRVAGGLTSLSHSSQWRAPS